MATNPKRVEIAREKVAFDPLMRPGDAFKPASASAPKAATTATAAAEERKAEHTPTPPATPPPPPAATGTSTPTATSTATAARPPIARSRSLFGDDGEDERPSGALFGEPDAPVAAVVVTAKVTPTATATATAAAAATPTTTTPAAHRPTAAAHPLAPPKPATSTPATAAPTPTPAPVSTAVEAKALTGESEAVDDPFGTDETAGAHDSFASLLVSPKASEIAASKPQPAKKKVESAVATPAPTEAGLFSDESGGAPSQHNLDGLFIPRGAAQARTDKDKAKFQELEDDLLPGADDDLDQFTKPKRASAAVVSERKSGPTATATAAPEALDEDLFAVAAPKPSLSASAAVTSAPGTFDFAAYISSAKGTDDSDSASLFS